MKEERVLKNGTDSRAPLTTSDSKSTPESSSQPEFVKDKDVMDIAASRLESSTLPASISDSISDKTEGNISVHPKKDDKISKKTVYQSKE